MSNFGYSNKKINANHIFRLADFFEKASRVKYAKKSKEEKNSTIANVGHFLLDVVGFIPGAGEFADAANALWYAKEGEYLMAGLSLLSVIPEIGDLAGKSTRLAILIQKSGKVGEHGAKLGGMLIKLGKFIKDHMDEIKVILDKARENEQIGEYVDKIDEAIEDFVHETVFLSEPDDEDLEDEDLDSSEED